MYKIKLGFDIEVDLFDKGIADTIKELHEIYVGVISKLIESDEPKPEPKEEVFYHRGQKFKRGDYHYILTEIGPGVVIMTNLLGTSLWSTKTKVGSVKRITEAEFSKMGGEVPFALIEDKKK